MLLVKDLGTIEFLSAVSLQEQIVKKKINGQLLADLLLLVEHPPVFTIGRSGKEEHLLERGKAPCYRTGRGGDITYHGPGQIVAYPLVDLKSRLRRDVRLYLARLERAAIRALRVFGIVARRNPPWTGVWVGERKIASIGIAVKRGVAYHGIALNVDVDLTPFGWIIPCGHHWMKITTMERELGRQVSSARVKAEFVSAFARSLGYSEVKEVCPEDIQIGSKSDSPEATTISGSKGF